MRRIASVVAALSVLAVLWAAPAGAGKKTEPERVVVQHVLIGFKKSVRNKQLERTKKEAASLADEIYKAALDGEDFDNLVKQYTDDKYPGMMRLTNRGAPSRSDAFTRDQVVPGFGDMSFKLEVGEIGLVEYGYSTSPFGWHIIKRLE